MSAPLTNESGKWDLIEEYEAWLGAALVALGVENVFQIPGWQDHLKTAAELNEAERQEARRAIEDARA